MGTAPLSQQPNDLTDQVTGLARYPVALMDIALLARQQKTERTLGVLTLMVQPDPRLYRLTPEAAQHLRNNITQQLSAQLRSKDRLYSVSHWEWLAVLPDLPSSAPLLLAIIKLQASFAAPLSTIDGVSLAPLVACGGAIWPDDGEDALHLVQSARIARLTATRDGTRYALYTRSMERTDAEQHQLHLELQKALGGAPGLALYLQPQIDLANGQCVGCEALLRWQRANGSMVAPHHVLAAVEHLGLRNTFTRWLLQQAMQSQKRLEAAGIRILLSINLSANDLLDAELPDLIAQNMATWNVSPDSILLELTETLMVEETQQVVDVLRRLREQGLRLSIDDFGTGYAGMSYLQRLPVQEVKIDQSFVRHAEQSERNREIIASVVQLAHRLGISVVAEGVETVGMAKAVRELGCDRAQGYLYTPALPLEAYIVWWQAHQNAQPGPSGES